MSEWRDKIPGCFGAEDKKFGRHPLDEARARELRDQLHREKVAWPDVERELRKHLAGCTQEHIDAEIREAKRVLLFSETRK